MLLCVHSQENTKALRLMLGVFEYGTYGIGIVRLRIFVLAQVYARMLCLCNVQAVIFGWILQIHYTGIFLRLGLHA